MSLAAVASKSSVLMGIGLPRPTPIQTNDGRTIAAFGVGYRPSMSEIQHDGGDSDPIDPDGDPEMKQSASQPNQAEGDDDPAETETS
jgi:hypothetical protein